MAREPQDIIKAQLGALMMEVAVTTSQLEKALEQVAQLEAELSKAVGKNKAETEKRKV